MRKSFTLSLMFDLYIIWYSSLCNRLLLLYMMTVICLIMFHIVLFSFDILDAFYYDGKLNWEDMTSQLCCYRCLKTNWNINGDCISVCVLNIQPFAKCTKLNTYVPLKSTVVSIVYTFLSSSWFVVVVVHIPDTCNGLGLSSKRKKNI